jgi:uncharacterized cupin superfamily protein
MPVLTSEKFIVEENSVSDKVDETIQPNQCLWISEAGGLTQFGSFIEILQPGSRSSLKHWHSAEDELIYILEGEVTVIEGDQEFQAKPGDAITFKAGVAVGHCLENRSTNGSITKCLVVGTRAPLDRITYPDHNRVCIRDRSLPDDIWIDFEGKPADSPYR